MLVDAKSTLDLPSHSITSSVTKCVRLRLVGNLLGTVCKLLRHNFWGQWGLILVKWPSLHNYIKQWRRRHCCVWCYHGMIQSTICAKNWTENIQYGQSAIYRTGYGVSIHHCPNNSSSFSNLPAVVSHNILSLCTKLIKFSTENGKCSSTIHVSAVYKSFRRHFYVVIDFLLDGSLWKSVHLLCTNSTAVYLHMSTQF